MKKIIAAFITISLFFGITAFPAFAVPETGVVFQHQKTGVETSYLVLPDGTAALGDGVHAAIPEDTTSLTIPVCVTYFEAYETVHPYSVSRIKSNAFAGCLQVKEIYIEGDIYIEEGALSGLPEDVHFTTASEITVQNLKDYGIPEESISYHPIKIKYVAFGDSIAAGYALAEYNMYDKTTKQLSDGDRFPTPSDAFVRKIGETLGMSGDIVWDNQAVSGWTSKQFLDMLQSGAYDATLENADIITVTIGSNDLLGPFIEIVEDVISRELGIEGITEISPGSSEQPFEMNIPINQQSDAGNLLEGLGSVTATLNDQLEDNAVLNQACKDFREIFQPAILQELSARAPKADIYWTTLYNPFYGVKLDLKELFPGLDIFPVFSEAAKTVEVIDLGGLGAQYIENMNGAFAVNREGYTSIPLYDALNSPGLTNVHIAGVGAILDGDLQFSLDPHPNKDGHQVIFDSIMPYLSDFCESEKVRFKDVKENDWFCEDVYYAVDMGWMNGVSEDSFAPYRIVSRAVVATVLWRMAGEPQPEDNTAFKAVKSGEWYEKAVAWAADTRITNGYGNGFFGTNDSVNREQLVAFLYRYAERYGYDVSGGVSLVEFADENQVSDYAKQPMEWAVGKGIISGKGDKVIDPKGTATAAEIAAITRRFYEMYE